MIFEVIAASGVAIFGLSLWFADRVVGRSASPPTSAVETSTPSSSRMVRNTYMTFP